MVPISDGALGAGCHPGKGNSLSVSGRAGRFVGVVGSSSMGAGTSSRRLLDRFCGGENDEKKIEKRGKGIHYHLCSEIQI